MHTRHVFTVCAALLLLPRLAIEAVPVINYQGRLLDGTNLVSGIVALDVRLYDADAGGLLLYEDSNNVSVADGLYSTLIGDGTTTGELSEALSHSNLWMETSVNGTTLAPRERVAHVAYAIIARDVRNPLNYVTGTYAFAPAGISNRATAALAVVGGGTENVASGLNSTVGGGEQNRAETNWATVAGGWTNVASGTASAVGGGKMNRASGDSSAVVGGRFSEAEGDASVAGGEGCHAIGAHSMALGLDHRVYSYASGAFGGDDNVITNTEYAFIGGGQLNYIDGFTEYSAIVGGFQNRVGTNAQYAIVAGGYSNHAAGHFSFAAGRQARAGHDGTFVWGDDTAAPVESSTSNEVTFRASGGFRIFSSAMANTGVVLAAGSGSWTSLSDRNAKKNFAPVEGREILARLVDVPLSTWSYKSQSDTVRHIGPTAQDFNQAFHVGDVPTGITGVDADGVALAAIQGLYQVVQDQQRRIEELERQLRAR